MKLNWKIAWHQVLISLMIGFMVGVFCAPCLMKYRWHREWKQGDRKEYMMQQMSRKLKLSAEQKTQLSAIFDAKHPQMAALHEEMRPKFEALRNETNAQIRKILNPDQLAKFEKINQEREKRWKKKDQLFKSARPVSL